MKACINCLTVKPIREFYDHGRMADGHLNKCKDCCKSYQRKRRPLLVSDASWMTKERKRCREKQIKFRSDGRAANTTSEVKNAWRKRNPTKTRAHDIARAAQQIGKIVKPEACHRCGDKRPLQKHHPDYSKPLDVVWLCSSCHGFIHRK